MANFNVKLVDHTGSTDQLMQLIQKPLQDYFNEVFAGQPDSATVTWGTAMPSDSLVLHFVKDVPSSYINQKMPGEAIRSDAGGHTRTKGSVTGSEFYKLVLFKGDSKPSQIKGLAMAKLAFHEAMHNKTGWGNQKLHGPDGGGGLAAFPAQPTLTEKNKEIMRTRMATKNSQLQ